jgi:CRP-like cAMP-binding protein
MAASESKLWYLEQINIFRDLDEKDLDRIDKMTNMRTMEKGKYIFFPDDPSKVVFLLKMGKVKIGSYSNDGKEIIKAILEPGEIFGEMAIVGQEKRRDFAQALTNDVRFCAIGVEEMKEMLMSNPQLNFEVTKTIGERLQKVERRLEKSTGLIFLSWISLIGIPTIFGHSHSPWYFLYVIGSAVVLTLVSILWYSYVKIEDN